MPPFLLRQTLTPGSSGDGAARGTEPAPAITRGGTYDIDTSSAMDRPLSGNRSRFELAAGALRLADFTRIGGRRRKLATAALQNVADMADVREARAPPRLLCALLLLCCHRCPL